jgi:hypothetical protein
MTYGWQKFVESLEPGINVLVMKEFETKLQKKLTNAVDETWAELKEELPEKITSAIRKVAYPEHLHPGIDVHIKIEKPKE